MAIDETGLTKGLVRKLNALRKSVGDNLAEEVFAKWLEGEVISQGQRQTRSRGNEDRQGSRRLSE